MTNRKLANNNIRLRTKSLKITCSEEDALIIVPPFVNITSYFLSVTRTNELPNLTSIRNSVKDAKIRLSSMISNALCKVVDYNQISNISIEVIAFGGYFKISLLETIPNDKGGVTIQGYNITLQCVTECPLISKLMVIIRNNNKDLKDNEVAELTDKMFNEIGL